MTENRNTIWYTYLENKIFFVLCKISSLIYLEKIICQLRFNKKFNFNLEFEIMLILQLLVRLSQVNVNLVLVIKFFIKRNNSVIQLRSRNFYLR